MPRIHLVIDGSRAPSTSRFGPLFDFDHMPEALQDVAEPFAVCAQAVVDGCPDGSDLTAALGLLLDARSCALRSVIGRLERTAAAQVAADPLNPSASVRQTGVEAPPPVLQTPAQAYGYDRPGEYLTRGGDDRD